MEDLNFLLFKIYFPKRFWTCWKISADIQIVSEYGDIDSNTLNIYKHYCQSANFRIKALVNWVTFSTTLLPLLTFLQAFAVFYEIVANILQHDKHLDDISIMWSLKTTASDIKIGTKSEHLIW